MDLPCGWLARREGDWLELDPPKTQTDDLAGSYKYPLPIPGRCAVGEVRLIIQATVVPADEAAGETPGSLLCRARLKQELTIRNWQPGDRFRPAHTGSEEKLKRLFAEKRIPADQRRVWPVALADSQIVWVRGFPAAHDFAWVPGSGDALRIDVLVLPEE